MSFATTAAAEDGQPREIVALFHASFHPTKGNIIDWALKVDDGLDLSGVEFSVLPSGLHLVEQDVLYFSHGPHTGLGLFRRRRTRIEGARGFLLSSLCILLKDSPHPRPWMHLPSLKALADVIYAPNDADTSTLNVSESGEGRKDSGVHIEGVIAGVDSKVIIPDIAKEWFERAKLVVDRTEAKGSPWKGWTEEIEDANSCLHTPTPHLPHLLRILGLSSLTLYKFILSRRRIMIFTLPPVEVSCILAWAAADLCKEHHMSDKGQAFGVPLKGLYNDHDETDTACNAKGSPRVLGMVTLSDLARLERESQTGEGWIACTTDAIFLEKPESYDLIIDLSTSTPSKSSRPTMYMSKPVPSSSNGKRKTGWKKEIVKYTWSDLRVWAEVDRILKLDASCGPPHFHLSSLSSQPPAFYTTTTSSAPTNWTDPFSLYDDVCLLCASLWMGLGTWRTNSNASFATAGGKASATQWGSVRLEGDDDWSINGTYMRTLGKGIEGVSKDDNRVGPRMRNLGHGIEGRPSSSWGPPNMVVNTPPRAQRQPSASSINKTFTHDDEVTVVDVRSEEADEAVEEHRKRNVRTTLAVLQTFHAHTCFLLSRLSELIPPPSINSTPRTSGNPARTGRIARQTTEDLDPEYIALGARDMLNLDLGIMSELDSLFIEWLADSEGYAGPGTGRKLVVKRRWKDLIGVVFGLT